MPMYRSVTSLIGHTPMVTLQAYGQKHALQATVSAKLEGCNPAGSIKDRVAAAMIADAEQSGRLQAGATLIEPTSGNTGIGLAAIGTAKGYRVILTMPDTMSVERRNLIRAYGADIVLTEGDRGMTGAIERAEALQAEIAGSVMMGQFTNLANPAAHYATTGPEIWEDCGGKVDVLVAGVGTGGTVTGAGRYLKERNPFVRVVAVEPERSPVLSGGQAGPHGIQGIGAGFVPAVLDRTVYDEVIAVPDDAALATGREIGRTEGFLAGISSGAALWAATQVALRPQNKGKHVVVIFPDTGDRYLSTPLFAL